jgi:hypothetical protein
MGKLIINPVQDGAVEADKQTHILDHNPCGSSAGSAKRQQNLQVAVTDGSVVCPSSSK